MGHGDDLVAKHIAVMIMRMLPFLLPLVLYINVDSIHAAFHSLQASPCSRRKSHAAPRCRMSARTEHDVSLTERPSQSRFHFLVRVAGISLPSVSLAFDGGVGGLGKTKPETGVVLWGESAPLQNQQGIVLAELNVGGDPVLVEFTTPWPLLPTTSGLEARNLQSSESAFVSVLPTNVSSDKQLKQAVLDNILGSQGKYGVL